MADGTGNPKDTSAATQDSSKGKQGTSEAQATKTYTEADVQKMVSDRLAQAGREAKTLEQRETAIKQREETLQKQRDDEQKRKDEEELEKARDNPDLMSAFQTKKQLREEREAIIKERNVLEQEKLAHTVEIESAREVRREIEIWDIAQKYGADAVTLKELNLDAKQTELIAQKIGTKKPDETSETTKVKHDSGMTTGGGENLGDLSPKERLKAIDKKLREK